MNRSHIREINLIDYLSDIFKNRQAKNSAYSVRAFARDLGVGRTTISAVLARKRALSPKNAQKIARTIGLDRDQLKRLTSSKTAQEGETHRLLSEDEYRLISDWYHFAILNLAKTKHNVASPQHISDHLGIPVSDVKTSLSRLERLSLLTIENGRLIRTSHPLTTTKDIPSFAIRQHHRQILAKAEDALENCPISERDYATVIMAINPTKLKVAKTMIQKFKRKLSTLLEEGQAEDVYCLAVQLFPLTQRRTGEQDE